MALINVTSFSTTENQSFSATGLDAVFNPASEGQWNFEDRTYLDAGTVAIDPGEGNTFEESRARFAHQGLNQAAIASNATYIFTDCNWEDSGNQTTAQSDALGTIGIKTYTFTRCLMVTVTGQETGFGESGGSRTNVLNLIDCVFAGYGDSKWFINVAGVAGVALPGTQLKNTALNTTSTGISFNGLVFDGSVRNTAHNTNGYTVRCVGGGDRVPTNFLTNFSIGDLGQYNVGESTTGRAATFTSHSSWNFADDSLYLINNQYQFANAGDTSFVIFASGTGSIAFKESYHWRPSFVRPDQTTATDIKFIDMLSTTGTDVIVQQMPTTTESGSTALTTVASNNDLYLPGYVIEVAVGEATDTTQAVTAAQQFDAGTEAHSLKNQFVITPFAKSFTDIVPIEVTSQVTDFTTDPTTFAVTSQAHAIPSAADLFLNGKTVTTALDPVASAADLYPQVKSTWYSSTANDTLEVFGLSIVNGILTTTKSITLGSASTYTPTALGFNCANVISATDTVTGIAGSTIEIDGTGFNGITINGATTGDWGALTGSSSITTTNTAAQTVASINDSELTSSGQITVSGTSTDGDITTTGSGDHIIVTGKATRGTLRSGARVQLDGGSEDVTANTTGHLDVNAGTHDRLTATTLGTSNVRADGAGVELNDCTLTAGGTMQLQDVTGGTYVSTGAMTVASIDGGTFTAPTVTLGGAGTNGILNGNVTALNRTLTNMTIGAGTHNLASSDMIGGQLSGTVDLGDGTLTGLVTLNNPTVTTTLTDLTGFSTVGNLTLTAATPLIVQVTDEQSANWTAGTNITFSIDYTLDITRTAGLLSVYRNDVLQTTFTGNIITGIQVNEKIDVVYSEAGRTDFYFTVQAAAPIAQTITVANAPTPYPSTVSVAAGLLVPQVPAQITHLGATRWVMDIRATVSSVSEGEVSVACQTQVKVTENYNRLIQRSGVVDIISSDGGAAPGTANQEHIQFTSTIPATVGYLRPSSLEVGIDATSQVLAGALTPGSFTPTGGTATPISIGVTMANIQAFDPAITGGQIEGARISLAGDIIDATEDTEKWVKEMRNNKLLGLKPQQGGTGNSTLTIIDADGDNVTP